MRTMVSILVIDLLRKALGNYPVIQHIRLSYLQSGKDFWQSDNPDHKCSTNAVGNCPIQTNVVHEEMNEFGTRIKKREQEKGDVLTWSAIKLSWDPGPLSENMCSLLSLRHWHYRSRSKREATTITTSLPEITPFIALQLRVARLEQEMSEVKKTDHSTDVLASIKSQVPTVVDKYLGTKLDDASYIV
ncbi:hypothetical protein Tco_1090357 [Tanacetum coccineum]|uniref:Uncharacterized protein n=1 Tax=Tanacetum coccineum TaxID=301880 RepID=A0ABQ5I3Y0_9ASTR